MMFSELPSEKPRLFWIPTILICLKVLFIIGTNQHLIMIMIISWTKKRRL